MASVIALRALVGAGLGLGALDAAWIDLSVGPRALAPEAEAPARAAQVAASGPAPAATAPAPAPAVTEIAPAIAETAPAPAVTDPAPPTEIFFATGSAALGPKARDALRALATRAPAGVLVTLEGHADYRGAEAANRALSADRATAAAEYLVQLGVARARLTVRHVGEDAAAPAGELWRDRRVDIWLAGGAR